MNSVGVVCALGAERRTLGRVHNGRVSVKTAGVGAERALRAARELADAGAQSLVSWGFAGGLDPKLEAGRLVLATAIVCESTSVLVEGAFATRLRERLAPLEPACAPLADGASAIDDVAAKESLHRTTSAVAVDMESAALGRFASERGLGFASVRAIVDDANTGLPASALAAVNDRGGTAWLALVGSLVRRPHELLALTRLSTSARKAERTLRAAATLCFEEDA